MESLWPTHEPPSGERKTCNFQTNILLMQDRFGFSWRMKSIFIQPWYHLQAKRVRNKPNSVTPLIRFQHSRNTQNGLGNSEVGVGFSDELRLYKITIELTNQHKSQTDTREGQQEKLRIKTNKKNQEGKNVFPWSKSFRIHFQKVQVKNGHPRKKTYGEQDQ